MTCHGCDHRFWNHTIYMFNSVFSLYSLLNSDLSYICLGTRIHQWKKEKIYIYSPKDCIRVGNNTSVMEISANINFNNILYICIEGLYIKRFSHYYYI